ncbi:MULTISPECIES: lipopolysaccharide transport periplasmic protein LptA [Deefgea]|uniref:Lipopolysaccharide export system protein LptA n=1 Tax=Deefgea chitinilytica TaxID=570276 RepID=A0ABS2C995_9NEIS|nr:MULTISPECIES: lipopolysaccharide transport periplasmic protein LptA [Deefgea]MBM5570053.1 lipopolysaccharide transport periplasmic protein LptA [Deefgea chitinilytica]
MSRYLVLPLLALILSSPSFAEKADREKPMNIVADHCLAEQKTQQTVCTGNVIVTQGTMVMRADKVVMRQDADGKQFAKGEGRPVRFKQKLDSGEMLDAESLSFDYDEVKGEMVLIDKAWVKKGQDVVMGDTINYNLNTEFYQAQSKPGNRVNITINPKKKDAAK